MLVACQGGNTGLNGRWTSEQYTCPVDVAHHETFDLVQSGSHVVATKTVGDQCIAAGHVTFTATVKGNSGTAQFYVATPGGRPTLGSPNQPLHIVSAQQFTIGFAGAGTITYTRAPTTKPHGWLAVAVALFALLALIGAIVVVPRRLKHRLTPQ